MKLVCGDCGAKYPAELRKQWGRTPETDGFGSAVQCVALVPGDGPLTDEGMTPQMICGGTLALTTEP